MIAEDANNSSNDSDYKNKIVKRLLFTIFNEALNYLILKLKDLLFNSNKDLSKL